MGARDEGVSGFMKGMAKGVTGAVALPVTGVAIGTMQIARGVVGSSEDLEQESLEDSEPQSPGTEPSPGAKPFLPDPLCRTQMQTVQLWTGQWKEYSVVLHQRTLICHSGNIGVFRSKPRRVLLLTAAEYSTVPSPSSQSSARSKSVVKTLSFQRRTRRRPPAAGDKCLKLTLMFEGGYDVLLHSADDEVLRSLHRAIRQATALYRDLASLHVHMQHSASCSKWWETDAAQSLGAQQALEALECGVTGADRQQRRDVMHEAVGDAAAAREGLSKVEQQRAALAQDTEAMRAGTHAVLDQLTQEEQCTAQQVAKLQDLRAALERATAAASHTQELLRVARRSVQRSQERRAAWQACRAEVEHLTQAEAALEDREAARSDHASDQPGAVKPMEGSQAMREEEEEEGEGEEEADFRGAFLSQVRALCPAMVPGQEDEAMVFVPTLLRTPLDTDMDSSSRYTAAPEAPAPGSRVMHSAAVALVWTALPAPLQRQDWQLLFDTNTHGYSLRHLYRQVAGAGPSVVCMRDSGGYSFGGFCSESWDPSLTSYYGTGESFLFQAHPEASLHRWQHGVPGSNDHFMLSEKGELLAMGGGSGVAFSLDAQLHHGVSEPCATFGTSQCLASSPHFKCVRLEIWGFAEAIPSNRSFRSTSQQFRSSQLPAPRHRFS